MFDHPPLSTRSRLLTLCAAALPLQALLSGAASAAVTIAGNLLVELNATNPTAGTAAWANTGTLGGSFAEVGDALPLSADGISYVSLGANVAYRGPTAPADITGSSDRTIEVWMRNTSIATEDTLVAWGHRGGPNGTNLAFNNGSNTTFGAVGHWGAADMGWNGTPAAGQLHHLVYTYDGATARVYADGVLKNTFTVALTTHSLATDTINLQAQNLADGNLAFISSDGYDLAVLRIHSGALSDADVLNNFNQGVPEPVGTGLLGMVAAAFLSRRHRAQK